MICLKCGNEMNDNEQVCSKCGYNKNTVSNTDNPFGVRNQGIYNPNAVDKEKAQERLEHQKQFHELAEIYMGPMYYNFKKGSFSWCAFFLGPFYFLYRKLYAIGILIFIMLGIIGALFNPAKTINLNNISNIQAVMLSKKYITQMSIYWVILLIFNIFLGLTFKKFYFNECMERVGKIKQQNPDLGYNQLTELVKRKGGTNILAPVLALLIPIAIIIIMMIISFVIIGSLLAS